MSKVRVLKNIDGTVSVIHYALKSKLSESEAFTKSTPLGAVYEDIDSSNLPSDREDRDAWEWDDLNKKVKVNQTKAQAIINEKKAEENLKKSAQDKLKALGLTDEEITILLKGG